MSVWAVIPVRSIANGKSRLATVLGRPHRQALNRALVGHTLEVASAIVDSHRVIVVSRCAETRRVARRFGANVLREPPGAGLNRAIGIGRDFAVARGCDGLLVLPCDLPFLEPADLASLMRAAVRPGTMVICQDRRGQGTNALFLRRPGTFLFRFGEDSATEHRCEARRNRLDIAEAHIPGIAFDLDSPADYRDFRTNCRSH